jgi:hypothetical protein
VKLETVTGNYTKNQKGIKIKGKEAVFIVFGVTQIIQESFQNG